MSSTRSFRLSILRGIRVGGAARVFVFEGGGPAGQQAQPVIGWAAGGCGEGEEVPAGIGGQVEAFVGEIALDGTAPSALVADQLLTLVAAT
jgi:hypothetical protein